MRKPYDEGNCGLQTPVRRSAYVRVAKVEGGLDYDGEYPEIAARKRIVCQRLFVWVTVEGDDDDEM